jgi:threonine/homoserine/homoserine lactone efflux protein
MTSLGLLLAPLALFMFVSSITPGPNNLMLLASGVRFGFARTVPHLLGITAGMLLLLAVSSAGVGALMQASPYAGKVLTLLCCAYLLWLAVGLLRAAEATAESEAAGRARPMHAWEAVLFQFVNPKGWAIAVAACTISTGLPLSPVTRMTLLLAVTVVVNLPCVSVWALFGGSLRRHLLQQRVRQVFNVAMAALVLATAVWMAAPLLHHADAGEGDPQADPALALGR